MGKLQVDEKVDNREMRLKHFNKIDDIRLDEDEAIWLCKKGMREGKEYLIRISKFEISNYIF